MSPIEAARILELAATIWSTVKDTRTTREAWFLALSRTNFYDAQDAIGELARERKTIHVSDVVKRAAQIRNELLRSLPPVPEPPDDLADDPRTYILWKQTARERQLAEVRRSRLAMTA